MNRSRVEIGPASQHCSLRVQGSAGILKQGVVDLACMLKIGVAVKMVDLDRALDPVLAAEVLYCGTKKKKKTGLAGNYHFSLHFELNDCSSVVL